jgi:hypothetical protein
MKVLKNMCNLHKVISMTGQNMKTLKRCVSLVLMTVGIGWLAASVGSANNAEYIDVSLLVEELPADKTTAFLRNQLLFDGFGIAATASEGGSWERHVNTQIPVLLKPQAGNSRTYSKRCDDITKLPGLISPLVVEHRAGVLAKVQLGDLAAIVNHPMIGTVDHQAIPVFNRAGASAPLTMVPNRVGEVRQLLKDRLNVSPTGEGLRIGVVSDGIAGSLWFAKLPDPDPNMVEVFPTGDCDAVPTRTITRVNPVIPVAYQTVYDGDFPSRSANDPTSQPLQLPTGADDSGDYLVARDLPTENNQFFFFHNNNVGFRSNQFVSFGGGDAASIAIFSYGLDIIGAGEYIGMECPEEGIPPDSDYMGDPLYAEEFVAGFIGTNATAASVIFNPSGFLANEGTAIIDIIRDYVPDAEFLFINSFSESDTISAINDLVEAECDIIVCDLAFFNTGPYDGVNNTGAMAYSNALTGDDPPIVLTSVGNFAQKHYQGVVSDNDNDRFHAFSGTDETMRIRIQPGETVDVYLSWDETPAGNSDFNAAQQDFQLFLLDPTELSINNPICPACGIASNRPQSGLQGQTPQEQITVAVSGGFAFPLEADVVVRVPQDVPNNIPFKVFVIPRNDPSGVEIVEYRTATGSIPQGPDSPLVFSVGELSTVFPNPVQFTSSQGPVFLDPSIIKPDFVAFSGINNSTGSLFVAASDANFPAELTVNGNAIANALNILPNNNPLTGTSGSVAEAAGITAMLLSYSNLTSDDSDSRTKKERIEELIAAGSRDMNEPGKDNISGFGRLDPYRAIVPNTFAEDTRYFYIDFNSVEEKQVFVPMAFPNLGFNGVNFTPPEFGDLTTVEPSGLVFTATNNDSTWGFYFSDALEFTLNGQPDGITIDPSKIYRVKVRIAEDFNAERSPTVRIRAQARTSTTITGHVLNDLSFPDHSNSFQTDEFGGSVYVHYFQPPESARNVGMEINVDVISFEPRVAERQGFIIQEIEVIEMDADL